MEDNFISNIIINKVRHLKNFEISLSNNRRKHLVLTGKNGSGKTSTLNSIQSYLRVIENGRLHNLLEIPKYIKTNKELISLQTDKLEIEKLKVNKEIFVKEKNRYEQGVTLKFNTIDNLMQKYEDGNYILAYFNARRDTKVELVNSIKKIDLKNKYGFDENLSIQFVQYLVYLKTQQSFAKNENDDKVALKIQTWFDNFEDALREIFEDSTLRLQFDYINYDFNIIVNEREPFGFNVLSDGYSSILNIVMELILRMEKNAGYYTNNKNKKYIYDIEGIVLIDEIETHLHIELQKKCLPFLIKLFPKIQFIITTHSPFVLTSIDDAIIYDLEHKIMVQDLSKYSYEGIVESYFDVDQYSFKIKKKMERYMHLTKICQRTMEEEGELYDLITYLNDISPELAPELVYKFREIELKRGASK